MRGTVVLPAELKAGRRNMGYWRVENGNVPIQPAASRGETVVVLAGPKGQAPGAKQVSVEIAGLQASPAVVVVGEGSVVEFKNADKVAHELSTPDQSSLMPPERLSPGAVRKQKFLVAGGYLVRCSEFPHIAISVVVVASPYFATADDKGGFRIGDVPEGKAQLKVWSHGRWVHEEEVDVGKAGDLQLKVSTGANKEPGGE